MRRQNQLKQLVVDYMESVPRENRTDEEQAILDFLKCHPFSVFPYAYTEKYKPENVEVYRDKEKKLYYVLHDGKRLYFKTGWDVALVQACYSALLLEQDTASPHRYETADFQVAPGDVVVDAGVAEGNFALSVVERAKELYLFEPNKDWIAPLEATFAPWRDKVHIINKCISDVDDGIENITLDHFFENKKIDFIKADIEGAEAQLLRGAQTLLSKPSPMKVVLCTYHRHEDAEMFYRMLMEKGFHTEFSKGYMIFPYDNLEPPYLRRGLIRAYK
ncbi:MAG: FkbM family methyltransferase [Dysgonamonadaceae bacterium]|nr:FkbM family methyltransferase [Dysgonamonadaceae bacterium]